MPISFFGFVLPSEFFSICAAANSSSVETLHQTYELIKTILGRITKSDPDLSQDPALEQTLMEIDKFCRHLGSTYKCRLSDDLLSELSDLLSAFDLPMDEIPVVKATSPDIASGSDTGSSSVISKLRAASTPTSSLSKPTPATRVTKDAAAPKNAFSMMMKKAGGKYEPSTSTSKPPAKARPRQMTLEEFENDEFLDNLSAGDLDILERRAASDSKIRKPTQPTKPKDRLIINVLPQRTFPPKATSSKATTYKSKFMRDLAADHRADMRERKRANDTVPQIKPVSVGTGLGAYTGPRKEVKKVEEEATSSESESSSDEENKGIGALVAKAKEPVKPARFSIPERRPIKVLGSAVSDILREREARRRAAHSMKMRLHPDLTSLYRYVLAWDPGCTAPRPPYPPKDAAELGTLKPMSTAFTSAEQYNKTILPLFLQELWAQFIKDDAGADIVRVEVTTRSYEDDFLDIDVVVPGNLPNKFFLNDNDIVTIKLEGPAGPNNPNKPIFAKVQIFRRKFKESGIKLRILSSLDQRALGSKAKLQLRKHTS